MIFWGIFDFHPGYGVINTGLNDIHMKNLLKGKLVTIYFAQNKLIYPKIASEWDFDAGYYVMDTGLNDSKYEESL